MLDKSNEKIAYSVTEAARLLGVSRPTMYQLIKQPGFPVFKVGARILVSRSGLANWIEQQTKGDITG